MKRLNAKQLLSLSKDKYHDGNGLYISFSSLGRGKWSFRYTFNKKQREMGLGSFPDVSLFEARQHAFPKKYIISEIEDGGGGIVPYEYKIKNFAVGGYGAYQSLLMQERILGFKKNIKLVVYGFIDHHELRNVAAGSWMYLLNKFSSRGHVKLPYVSINEFEKIERHKPIEYINLPFRKKSALVAKIEKKIMKLKSNQREKDKFIISKKIIQLMKINSEKINSEFIVLMLDNNEESFNNYKKYFLKEKINFVKCNFPAGEVVKGEGHPNAKAHGFVANCLNDYFTKLPL